MGNIKRSAIAFVIAGAVCGGTTIVSCGGGDDSAASPDATADVALKDTSVANFDASDGNTCFPTLPPGWPTWTPPNPIDTTACTTAQVQSLYDNCYSDTSTTATCNAFYGAPGNSPCIKCISSSSQGSATYGPLVGLSNGSSQSNVAGCIALTDGDLSATGCGAQYQAWDFCYDLACSDNCQLDRTNKNTLNDTYNDYLACRTAAGTAVCKPYKKPACASDPKYAHCIYVSFESYFIGLGDYACSNGLPVSDAGVDASDDASDAADD